MTRYEEIRTREYEVIPNKLVAYGFLMQGVFELAVWMLNEAGLFQVVHWKMRLVGFVTLALMSIVQLLAFNEKLTSKKATKYIIMMCSLACTFTTLLILYQWSMLLLMLPLFFAVIYKDQTLCVIAYIGSAITAAVTPVVGITNGLWSTNFMKVVFGLSGYDITVTPIANPDVASNAKQVVLFIGLPNAILVTIFFIIARRFNKLRIDNAENQIKTIMLEETDVVTGLYNRQSLVNRMQAWRKMHSNMPYVCIYADAHGLCDINNKFGYLAGDEMLVAVANELKDAFGYENVYKLSGGTFVVILFDCEREGIDLKVENIRSRLKAREYHGSIGTFYADGETSVKDTILEIEKAVKEERAQFYQLSKNDRRRNR